MAVWSHLCKRRLMNLCLTFALDGAPTSGLQQIHRACSIRTSGCAASFTDVRAGHQQQMYGMREKTAIWRNTLHLAGISHNTYGQHP